MLEATVAQQEKEVQALTVTVKTQAEQIQNVREQLNIQVAPRWSSKSDALL